MVAETEEYDEDNQIKEAFAYFGRAVYMVNVLETGLVHVLLQIDFMTKVRDEFIRTQGRDFSRDEYEKNFDAFIAKHFSQTMGNLIRRIYAIRDFDPNLKERLAIAKRRRDYLVHGYWRDMAVPFSTKAGRDKIIDELKTDAETLRA